MIHRVSAGWAWVERRPTAPSQELTVATADLRDLHRAPLDDWPFRVMGLAETCVDIEAVMEDALLFDCWVGPELEHTIYAFGLDGGLRRSPMPTNVRGASGSFPVVLDEQGYHFALAAGPEVTPVRVDPGGRATMGATATLSANLLAARWNGIGWTLVYNPDLGPTRELWLLSEGGDARFVSTLDTSMASEVFHTTIGDETVSTVVAMAFGTTVFLLRHDARDGRLVRAPAFVADDAIERGPYGSVDPRPTPISEGACGTGVFFGTSLVRMTPEDTVRETVVLPSLEDVYRASLHWLGDRYAIVWTDSSTAHWIDMTEPVE
jgi:hypothetical protein